MPINDQTPDLAAVISALRGQSAWAPDGTQLKIYVGFFTAETFAFRASQLGWVLQPDGSSDLLT